MLRCCQPHPDDFAPCYASVLLAPPDSLRGEVERVERAGLCHCVTAWCDRCARSALIVQAAPDFPSRSAHHAHLLALWHRLQPVETQGPSKK